MLYIQQIVQLKEKKISMRYDKWCNKLWDGKTQNAVAWVVVWLTHFIK